MPDTQPEARTVPSSAREVAQDWYERAATVGYGHYRAALRFSRLNFFLGFPTVVLATVVGTSVFASLQKQPEVRWQVLIGTMSIVAAILSALQSFLGYGDKAERHRIAGARYNAVGRELELMLARDRDWQALDDVRHRIDSLAQESPHIPESVHKSLPASLADLMWHRAKSSAANR